jgi:hypothetical protein
MLETAALVVVQPSAEAQSIGVYVLVGLVGLLVCGLLAIARELRPEAASQP